MFLCIGSLAFSVPAQAVKRVVVLKIDGLPGYVVERFINERDPATGKSVLPWFEEVFYKNGTRVPNFYTRGPSLSGPSWGQLDTGRHLQIKGNVEYDRFSRRAYDYLNFIPYYIGYGLNKKADMPAVEVMDQLHMPLMSDAFPFEKRYTSQQLFQRGNDWAVLASGFLKMYPGNASDFLDEWTIGFNVRQMTIDQAERDILGKIIKNPEIDFFDYYDTAFDHISHTNNDSDSKLVELKVVDRLIGKMWTAIQNSSRSAETALVLVSDHGINSKDKVYSQGFNLVRVLGSAAGGGNHVVTKRRLMLDYTVKGIYPLVPLITTASKESNYLKGESSRYPTTLVDFDGNERSTIHLRNSDLNILHILLQQLQRSDLSRELKVAAMQAMFEVIDRNRNRWRETGNGLGEELDALHRWIESQRKTIAGLPSKQGDKEDRETFEKKKRSLALTDIAVAVETDYRKYLASLNKLLSLNRETFASRKYNIEDLITPWAMGDRNTVHQLQNYVGGLSREGLVLDAEKGIDLEKSFTTVNYFELLHQQKVRSNVQPEVSNRPVDFIAIRIPARSISISPLSEANTEDVIWLYGGPDKQALLQTRLDPNGRRSYRYLPVSGLRADAADKITFQQTELADGFPLNYFEDTEFAVSASERKAWLTDWHDETDWMKATHKTANSNAVISLVEQLYRHPVFDAHEANITADDSLIRRFRQRQRNITEPDLVILANNHWNFDVRGFNPGGNHGSFRRVSTNSTLMIAGGPSTGIRRGFSVETPYDGLSFMPTILRLMGKVDSENRPVPALRERGFRQFPGKVIREITEPSK